MQTPILFEKLQFFTTTFYTNLKKTESIGTLFEKNLGNNFKQISDFLELNSDFLKKMQNYNLTKSNNSQFPDSVFLQLKQNSECFWETIESFLPTITNPESGNDEDNTIIIENSCTKIIDFLETVFISDILMEEINNTCKKALESELEKKGEKGYFFLNTLQTFYSNLASYLTNIKHPKIVDVIFELNFCGVCKTPDNNKKLLLSIEKTGISLDSFSKLLSNLLADFSEEVKNLKENEIKSIVDCVNLYDLKTSDCKNIFYVNIGNNLVFCETKEDGKLHYKEESQQWDYKNDSYKTTILEKTVTDPNCKKYRIVLSLEDLHTKTEDFLKYSKDILQKTEKSFRTQLKP